MKKYTFYNVTVKVVAGINGIVTEAIKWFSNHDNAVAFVNDWENKAAELGIPAKNRAVGIVTSEFVVEDEADARIPLVNPDAELQAAMGNKPPRALANPGVMGCR